MVGITGPIATATIFRIDSTGTTGMTGATTGSTNPPPSVNRIYVANNFKHDVSVIDGNTNSVIATITKTSPQFIGVNQVTNRIYMENAGSNNVSVIDGSTNSVITTIPVENYPVGVAVNR